MRGFAIVMALMLMAAPVQAQTGGKSPSARPDSTRSDQGFGQGAGQSGLNGYGYSTGKNPAGHYGGGYIRSDGSFMRPGGSALAPNTQTDGMSTRRTYDPETGTYRSQKRRD
jgi:hypothetical protein